MSLTCNSLAARYGQYGSRSISLASNTISAPLLRMISSACMAFVMEPTQMPYNICFTADFFAKGYLPTGAERIFFVIGSLIASRTLLRVSCTDVINCVSTQHSALITINSSLCYKYCDKVLVKVAFGTAPTTVSTCRPPLKTISVGILRIP